MRSGVNWIRAYFQRKAAASALTISVLARPGTPTSKACEPVRAQTSNWSMTSSWPTTTSCSVWRMVRTRWAKVSTSCRTEFASLAVTAIGWSPVMVGWKAPGAHRLRDAPYYQIPLTASFARLFLSATLGR